LKTAIRITGKITIKEEIIMEIKVLGPGCPKCQQTEKVVKEAVAEAGVDAQVEKVTDTMEIAGYGVFGTPAVVVDGEVKSVGKIPKKEEVKTWVGQ
jgi:small redox-active disulfide protein 2